MQDLSRKAAILHPLHLWLWDRMNPISSISWGLHPTRVPVLILPEEATLDSEEFRKTSLGLDRPMFEGRRRIVGQSCP